MMYSSVLVMRRNYHTLYIGLYYKLSIKNDEHWSKGRNVPTVAQTEHLGY